MFRNDQIKFPDQERSMTLGGFQCGRAYSDKWPTDITAWIRLPGKSI